jgi:hypothetical protein
MDQLECTTLLPSTSSYRPHGVPPQPERAVVPETLTVAPLRQALLVTIVTNLRWSAVAWPNRRERHSSTLACTFLARRTSVSLMQAYSEDERKRFAEVTNTSTRWHTCSART